jgi:hypothetical protein
MLKLGARLRAGHPCHRSHPDVVIERLAVRPAFEQLAHDFIEGAAPSRTRANLRIEISEVEAAPHVGHVAHGFIAEPYARNGIGGEGRAAPYQYCWKAALMACTYS